MLTWMVVPALATMMVGAMVRYNRAMVRAKARRHG